VKTRDTLSLSVAVGVIVGTLLSAGCHAPPAKPGGASSMPNFGPPMQDTRTEAVIQRMELDYIAAKNSRPTYQHVAEAEKKRKEQEQAQAEAAKKAETKPQEPPKEPESPTKDTK
jgi:hypothetical protein